LEKCKKRGEKKKKTTPGFTTYLLFIPLRKGPKKRGKGGGRNRSSFLILSFPQEGREGKAKRDRWIGSPSPFTSLFPRERREKEPRKKRRKGGKHSSRTISISFTLKEKEGEKERLAAASCTLNLNPCYRGKGKKKGTGGKKKKRKYSAFPLRGQGKYQKRKGGGSNV